MRFVGFYTPAGGRGTAMPWQYLGAIEASSPESAVRKAIRMTGYDWVLDKDIFPGVEREGEDCWYAEYDGDWWRVYSV